ncbi:hypothetical protein [Streptomyces chattanoogensis]|uniref:hypothetical protein n=1 Tax=Streptomyces chattanoogensis TaxID=66876 RepID=UPI0036C88974
MVDVELAGVGEGFAVVGRAPGAAGQTAARTLLRLLHRLSDQHLGSSVAAVVVGVDPQVELGPLVAGPGLHRSLQPAHGVRQPKPAALPSEAPELGAADWLLSSSDVVGVQATADSSRSGQANSAARRRA